MTDGVICIYVFFFPLLDIGIYDFFEGVFSCFLKRIVIIIVLKQVNESRFVFVKSMDGLSKRS